jgi:hypothetical protein
MNNRSCFSLRAKRRTKRLRALVFLIVAGLTPWLGAVARGAEPPGRPGSPPAAAGDDVVMLPEFKVDGSTGNRPCLYGEVPGFQFLSLATAEETKAVVHEIQRQKFLLDLVVPEDLRPAFSAPILYIINDASANPALTEQKFKDRMAEMTQQTLDAFRADDPTQPDVTSLRSEIPSADPAGGQLERGPGWAKQTVTRTQSYDSGDGQSSGTSTGTYTRFFTSGMGASAQDMDEQAHYSSDWKVQRLGEVPLFFAFGGFSKNSTRFPNWFSASVGPLLTGAQFGRDAVRFRHQLSGIEAGAFPPIGEFFRASLPPQRTKVDPLASKARILFAAWALLDDPARATAFWNFVRRAESEPVDDALLKESFGLDYAGLKAELLRFVRSHKKGTFKFEDGAAEREFQAAELPEFSDIALHPATRAELVRGKSEWERLTAAGEGSFLITPAERERLLRRAEARLEKAYRDGEKDPQLVSVLALVECDLGDEAKARPLLEEAVAGNVPRPRIYYELARVRFHEARAQPLGKATGSLSDEQADRALAPLSDARKLFPVLQPSYALATNIAMHSARPPDPAELAIVGEGARLFPSNTMLAYRGALLNARAGQKAEALALVELALKFTPAASREQLVALKAALETGEKLTEMVVAQSRLALRPGNDLSDATPRARVPVLRSGLPAPMPPQKEPRPASPSGAAP